MNIIQLTQKLVSMPSYIGANTNEKAIGDFVFRYLRQFPYLKVRKQRIAKNRFNIIAETKGVPWLLLAGHLDTVEPKQGWSKNQFKGIVEDQRLYGLGALDTKSGIAAMLSALQNFTQISGLTLLFYCDEEYDFQGMKKFIDQTKIKNWDLAILTEPTNLQIWNAHRGLIEIYFSIQGKSGHASNPTSGKNAINGITDTLNDLQKWLSKFDAPVLGSPSLNIAYVRGGLDLGKNKKEVLIGKQGNNIADFAEAIIDIRPTKIELRAEKIIEQLQKVLKTRGYQLLNFSIRHNYGSLYTDPNKLKLLEKVMKQTINKAEYLNPTKKGYGDGQLLQEKFDIPVIYLGPKGTNAHGIDEWVDISSIKKLQEVYSTIIKEYCQ